MPSVKKELSKGVFWIAVAKYSGIVIQLLITAILARRITPTAFGTVAIASVVLYFLDILSDIGIGPAVVQYKQLTKSHLNSLFTLTTYIGVLLTAMLYLLSSYISVFYDDVTLERVCQLMSIVIFFHSLNVVPYSLLRKEQRFRAIAFRSLFFRILSGCIAVWGAFHGWGVYALLVSPILTAIGFFCLCYIDYPLQFVLRMDKEAVKMVASFSFFQFAFSFCNYFSRNLDKLIIGKYFSMTQLGYYDKSYHLMMLPIQNVSYVIEPVLHPVLSTLQNDKRELKAKNQKLAVLISNISFPIGLMLYFCGAELIRIVYGGQWDAAVPVFRILALSLPLQMILSTNVPLFQAAGKTNHLFMSGILNTCCTVIGFFIAAYWGNSIEAVAWSWDITLTINFINTYLILHIFTLTESFTSFFKSLFPQCANSIVVFIVVTYLIQLFHCDNIIVNLIIKSIEVLGLTLLMARFLHQYQIKDLVKGIIKRK
jgi:PST family polysaccharide transporter